MATNVTKEKERQETLLYIFVFLISFIILMWLLTPSFDFSISPEIEIKERRDHLEIIGILEQIDFEEFSEFNTIPEFEGEPGRANPFSVEVISITPDNLIEEEFVEESEEELEED